MTGTQRDGAFHGANSTTSGNQRHAKEDFPPMGYRVLDARKLEDRRKLIARELGARAIKLNRFDNEADQPSKEHDERESGQEEIYIPVAGSGRIVVDGDEVALEPGIFVLVEPESTRQVVAGPAGLSYVIVGAQVGAS